MAKGKPSVEKLMHEHLGKEVGNKVLEIMGRMINEEASPEEIENAISREIALHIEPEVVFAVRDAITRGHEWGTGRTLVKRSK